MADPYWTGYARGKRVAAKRVIKEIESLYRETDKYSGSSDTGWNMALNAVVAKLQKLAEAPNA